MKTLKLFNAVIAKESAQRAYISDNGYIVESNAMWAIRAIKDYFKYQKLDGYGLNKTFHKSWLKIRSSSRKSLLHDQILHYVSTYGSGFLDEVYIPNELLNVPDAHIVFKIVRGCSKEEMTQKCLDMLTSGIALKEETIDDVLSILIQDIGYKFSGKEAIKNKEALVKIADLTGVLPTETIAFFRFILYRSIGSALLIKNEETIEAIKRSRYNPALAFQSFGLEKLASIFNRFKPLFLAYKSKCPGVINKISKLSKRHHQPMPSNPLNFVTSVLLEQKDISWLDKATPFALFRALAACESRKKGQYSYAYRIRNGKSYFKQNNYSGVVWPNYEFLMEYCRSRFSLEGKTFYIPDDVEYALPTSEKMFVGNIPTGTKFEGNSLAVGIYWENIWGANDLDLSGLNIAGKIGWNGTYNQADGGLMYSGDITSAPNGAVEYLYAKKGLSAPTLIQNNVYSGMPNCTYKIVVGKGSGISQQFMMDPNKLMVEATCQSVQKQSILGILIPEKNKQSFVLLNFGAGHCRVSGNSPLSTLATKALYQQWKNPLTFRTLITELGAKIVNQPYSANYDFSLINLEKDSFTSLFQ